MASKPVILAVHGAWHTAACFSVLIDKLSEAGYETVAPTHLSCSSDAPPDPLGADSQQVRKFAVELAEQGKEMIVLAHSYGGVVATNSLFGLGVEQRRKEGLGGGVKAIIYMCAFMPMEGESLFGAFGLESGNSPVDLPWMTVTDGWLVPRNEDMIFYNDLPPDEAQQWVKLLTPHPAAAQGTPVEHAAWREIPVAYILCELDAAIPLDYQKHMVDRVKQHQQQEGKTVMTWSLSASHSPFLSMPGEIVRIVQLVDERG